MMMTGHCECGCEPRIWPSFLSPLRIDRIVINPVEVSLSSAQRRPLFTSFPHAADDLSHDTRNHTDNNHAGHRRFPDCHLRAQGRRPRPFRATHHQGSRPEVCVHFSTRGPHCPMSVTRYMPCRRAIRPVFLPPAPPIHISLDTPPPYIARDLRR